MFEKVVAHEQSRNKLDRASFMRGDAHLLKLCSKVILQDLFGSLILVLNCLLINSSFGHIPHSGPTIRSSLLIGGHSKARRLIQHLLSIMRSQLITLCSHASLQPTATSSI